MSQKSIVPIVCFEKIGPAKAAQILKNNNSNRPVSDQVINAYTSDMKRGEWKKTHQGILIGKDGNLIDGQHRLLAIIKSGVSVEMMIVYDETFSSAIDAPVDNGRKRQSSFILGKDRTLVGAATLGAKLFTASAKINRQPTLSDISQVINIIEPSVMKLYTRGQKTVRGITQAPMYLCAAAQMISGENEKFILDSYEALSSGDYKMLIEIPYAMSFYKQVVEGQRAYSAHQLFTRYMRIFSSEYSDRAIMKIPDEASAYAIEKDKFSQIMIAAGYKVDE